MNLSDLIERHIKDAEATSRDASRVTRGAADLGLPAQLFAARLARVDARIAELEQQRAQTDKRLVTAIEEQKLLRDDMAKEAKVWAERDPSGSALAPKGQAATSGSGKPATAGATKLAAPGIGQGVKARTKAKNPQ